MTFLADLLNPPPTQGNLQDHYLFFNSVSDGLNGLTYISNPSVLNNANFATLGTGGLTPVTQADGDGTEFSDQWSVFGASNANYIITPTPYPNNSTIKSSSDYFTHMQVTSHNGGSFYLYQKQLNSVRKYQKDYLTYNLIIKNNQTKAIRIYMSIFCFYDPANSTKNGKTIFLQPGMNKICSTILTDSLNGMSVGSGNYTEFRFNFGDLVDGTANLDIYQIKCEFGILGTPLQL